MASTVMPADSAYLPSTVRRTAKLLVAGHFGVGKTTLVGSVSEIAPLRTEEAITEESVGIDDLAGLPGKTRTTVALDFGRISVDEELVLYLFGTPGQRRFVSLWENLARGALGALVLVDTRRLEQSHDVLGWLEERGLPYAVAVNEFDGAHRYPPEEIRDALDLAPTTPLTTCDARDRTSSVHALITLAAHVLHCLESRP
ncbi:ATP-binding protein [Streptomyces carminius]|uniref:ATP-binding protein n=1 Tax=Streptomyces carminius TaxID=2665496 RepID=A0A2M8M5S4_9ACTN|nr:ATP/GTP-binding protein [Streptomyces carminius]PJE99562.1 ATP-binding protein [Streptomyces carminius]